MTRDTVPEHPRNIEPHSLGFEEAVAYVTTTNPTFLLKEIEIRGERYPIFANAPQTVPEMLLGARAAYGGGSKTHLVYRDERLSFNSFLGQVAAAGTALRDQLGVRAGDRVAIVTRNYPEMVIALHAISVVGAVPVLMNGWWTSQELEFGMTDCNARVAIADGPRLERLMPLRDRLDLKLVGIRDAEEQGAHNWSALVATHIDAPMPEAQIAPDDEFAIMYSSGSTGAPKGVIQTHRGVVNAVWSWMMQPHLKPLMAGPDEPQPAPMPPSYLVVTPFFHVTALYPLYMLGIPVGAKITIMHKWDAQEAIKIIRDEEVTRFIGVPTQTADLTAAVEAAGIELPSLRYMGSGGAKRPAAHVAGLARAFPAGTVATGWGMTETTALGIGMIGDDYTARPDAAGRLYPPIQRLRVMDESGKECAVGEPGELQVRSVAVMRGYLGRPDATAEVLRDGWLSTGDIGSVDSDGFVTIHDRKKNIVIRGGENISCAEVEEALHAHPAVIEACVFSVPDNRLGEVAGAALQLRASVTEAELTKFLESRLAAFKIPERFWMQNAPLPRGATDKTDRRAVRAACLDA
ncbi:class I adenylate-forming enzyme family protein [Paracoccus sediminicola]|uniref:class I adenylate-forming enzyme family protein n=1 Tax=Paracoccus sediminicola TaxID=3017783 RepID=UPI0022F1172F|nr:class I adenylate-forming enzyme family protein [Paracoccus sediminicola]WBU56170.1 class I adenylate-forming enzyme family protein [Paracoccus sediminicola]